MRYFLLCQILICNEQGKWVITPQPLKWVEIESSNSNERGHAESLRWVAGNRGKVRACFSFIVVFKAKQTTHGDRSMKIISNNSSWWAIPWEKNRWCAEKMRVRTHGVWTRFFRQWRFGVCPVCHVHWLNPEYMLAIFDHHLPYWFVSKGTVIKKPLIYCPYLLMGFFYY